jgi:predicted small lipoprotein YifL
MRTPAYLTLSVLAALALSGCGRIGLLNRDAPDEMAVTRKAPLVIPPDFALTPPAPGSADSQNTDLQRQAVDALFGGPAPRSPGETSALSAAGRETAAAGIRSNVGDPETQVVNKGAVTRDIVAAPEGDGQNARAVAGQ